MLNSIFAVLGGFVAMAIIVMVTTALAAQVLVPGGIRAMTTPNAPLPRAYLTANLACSTLAALVGGALTARIAHSAPLYHGLALAALMVGMSMVSMRQAGDRQPRWYQMTLLTLMPLLATIGAWIAGTPPA